MKTFTCVLFWLSFLNSSFGQNSNKPVFDQQKYEVEVPENAKVDTIIWRDLVVTDVDTVNRRLEVICDSGLVRGQDTCQRFILVTKESNSTIWRGDIVLKIQLNYAKKSVHEMPLRAWDGVNEARKTFTIKVIDIQNLPPVFTSDLSVVVDESVNVGSVILDVTAEDGDRGQPRPIRYELTSNVGDYFRIDVISGALSTIKSLNREDQQLRRGFVKLQVTAREVIGSTLGQDALTSKRVTVTVTILDVNDNSPKFSKAQYESSMYEDVGVGHPLITMTVTDQDTGVNAQYQLFLTRYADLFELFPSRGSGTTSVQVRVKNNKSFDYDKGLKQYIMPIIAMETGSGQNKTGETQLIVNVQDVDDNKPEFEQTSYTAQVSEMATRGTPVITITATDADSSPSTGIDRVSYLLLGNEANRFDCNSQTGLVTVANCSTPGSGNCMDFEEREKYMLTFVATVNSGEGATVAVPLIISVIDANDVAPRFTADKYVGFINEGEQVFQPTLKVEAIDGDSSLSDNNKVTYSIVSSPVIGLFIIGSSSGLITASRPVIYDQTPNKSGLFTLSVEASDGINKAVATVNIQVNDRNNHAPVFRYGSSIGSYVASIPESAETGREVILVDARDADAETSLNGQLTYRIESGSRDKFRISKQSGQISVAEGVTFDYDKIPQYRMKVIATDKGQPPMTDETIVVVNVQNNNNKNPYFTSPVIRADVFEDKAVNSEVITVKAIDPDNVFQLSYTIEDPKKAWDTRGREVDPQVFDFRDMFSVEQMTGIVRINKSLQRDKAAVVSMTIKAMDIFGGKEQTGTVTLLITILNVNDKAPIFAPPWTSTKPVYNISVKEEQLPGAFVMVMVASDPDGSVSKYEITDDPEGFFSIDPRTGLVTLSKPINYESKQTSQYKVIAYDNGQPQLNSSATVYVDIENINDETPTFTKDAYSAQIQENSPDGAYVTTVSASDGDQGTFGYVTYTLQDPNDRFSINPTSGVITVNKGETLDREDSAMVVFTVTAHDSPELSQFRRTNAVPVYVTLEDVNDNQPVFRWSSYEAVIVENTRVNTRILQISATDKDAGPNSDLVYYTISGNPNNYFNVNNQSGEVTVNQPLIGQSGTYSILVGVKDQPIKASNELRSNVTVTIKVISVNNAAPEWILPATNNATINVLENQYSGMVVTQVEARDGQATDERVTYHFLHGNTLTSTTPEFGINQITGVVTARVTFDRETRDVYSLMLVALDNGNPPFQSTRSLTIQILDVDDHVPEFPAFYNCCIIPYTFSIEENSSGHVGTVNAKDPDIGQHASISYEILSGNTNNLFTINSTSGDITLTQALDRETSDRFTLIVQAVSANAGAPDQAKFVNNLARCACREAPSVVTVRITVQDVNDNKPEFSQQDMFACVLSQAQFGHKITQVTGSDRDTGVNAALTYSINSVLNINEYGDKKVVPAHTFTISKSDGSVSLNDSLLLYHRDYFEVDVGIEDGSGSKTSSKLRIWVSEPSNLLVASFDKDLVAVQKDIIGIKTLLSQMSNGGLVFVSQLRYHMAEDGIIDPTKTDVLFYVVQPKVVFVYQAQRIAGIMWGKNGDSENAVLYKFQVSSAALIAVKPEYAAFAGFWFEPVLYAVIIILIVLVLMLLILCCFCLCIRRYYKKQIKRIRYDENKTRIIATGRINPLWKEKLYDEHATGAAFDNIAFEDDQAMGKMELDENMASAATIAATATLSRGDQTAAEAHVTSTHDEVDAAATSSAVGGGGVSGTTLPSGGASLMIKPAETVTHETTIEREYSMNYEHKKMSTLAVDNDTDGDVKSALAGFMDFTSEYGGASDYGAVGGTSVAEAGSRGPSSIDGRFSVNKDLDVEPIRVEASASANQEVLNRFQQNDMANTSEGLAPLTVDTTSVHQDLSAPASLAPAPALSISHQPSPPIYTDINTHARPMSQQSSSSFQFGTTVEQPNISAPGPTGRRAGGAAAYIQQRYGSPQSDYGSLRDPDPNLFRPSGTRYVKRSQLQNTTYDNYQQSPTYHQSTPSGYQSNQDMLMYDVLPAHSNQYHGNADIHVVAPAHTIPLALASPGGFIQQQQGQPFRQPPPQVIVTSDRHPGPYAHDSYMTHSSLQPPAPSVQYQGNYHDPSYGYGGNAPGNW